MASQWIAAFRFIGLSSADPTFLEDVESGLARALTQYYVEAGQGSTDYGFFFASGNGSIDPITGPGTRWTDQLWMVSLYDTNTLYRLEVDPLASECGATMKVVSFITDIGVVDSILRHLNEHGDLPGRDPLNRDAPSCV